MDWNRVFKFSGILFLYNTLALFPIGYIVLSYTSRGNPVPTWLALAAPISVELASIIIFIVIATKLANKFWVHGFTVAALAWLISYPVYVFFHWPFKTWISSGIFFFIACLIGTVSGKFVRKKIHSPRRLG